MLFLLGTHQVDWLDKSEVPLFISAVRLRQRVALPKAIVEWVLDSGGFTELDKYGEWTIPVEQYVAEVIRWAEKIGMMKWAAIQDWMCEPKILAKTGLDVREHQRRTIASLLELRRLAPQIPWVPVIQGWRVADYEQHVVDYMDAGVDLTKEEIVGVGSVCRRQGTREGAAIMRAISKLGISIHAFGIKTDGIAMFGDRISSADSMAWSLAARKRRIQLPGCTHKTCANCYKWASMWRAEMLAGVGDIAVRAAPPQMEMPW